MSLLDKRHIKDLCNQSRNRNGNQRNNNNRNNNNKNRNNNPRNNNRNNNRNQDFGARAMEILRRFDSDSDDTSVSDVTNTTGDQRVNDVKEVLAAFVDTFTKNIAKPAECKDIIEESIGDVCAALRYYYDPKFESALNEMNKTLDIMSTNQFASLLLTVLKQNPFGDEWNEMWKDVAFAISLLLGSTAGKMKEGTVQIYVNDILASNGMWKTEINQLVNELGITEDLAIDLIIGLPVKPEDMTDLIMRHTYQAFLYAILNHADDNIEVLDRNTQKTLFDFFFDDGRGKLACKVIGRFLSSEDPSESKEFTTSAALVCGEFKAMLLERLESYDVNDIAFVLRFVIDQKKRGNESKTIFSAEDAAKYDTIRKAIMQVVSKDESAKEYLV